MSARIQTNKLLAIIISGALSLAASGCGRGGGSNANSAGGNSGGSGVASAAEAAPVSVGTVKVESREVPAFIQATGSLIATETSDVAPQTSGQVTATPVNVGAFVRRGDVIARINDRDARLRLQQAQAAVQQAQASVRQVEAGLGLRPGVNFEAGSIPEVRSARALYDEAVAQLRLAEANEKRYRELVETGDVPLTTYEQFRTARDTARARVNSTREQLEAAQNAARQGNEGVQSAEAAVAAARANAEIAQKVLTDTVVRAPYAGYVSNRPIAVGEYVTSASIVATVLRTDPIRLQLLVPEFEASRLKPGMGVSLEVEAYRDRRFAGRVTAVNPAIDPVSRSITVEADVDNPDNALRAGMYATARLAQPGGARGIFVPRRAVFTDLSTQSYRVFVIDGETARLRVVQIGGEEGDSVQVISGLQGGETLATGDLQRLYEGARVRPQ